MKDITIVATTWLPPGQEMQRWHDFKKAYVSWYENLKYDGNIHLHIADDGTEEPWWDSLQKAILWDKGNLTFSQQQRHGVGASLNAGLNKAFETSPIVLHAVDDWELLQPLDLNTWVNFIEDNNYVVDVVRFFGHPDLTGTIKHIPPHGWAVKLDNHHYAFATRPCLWKKSMFDFLGYFKEDVSAIEVEQDFNFKAMQNGMNIWMAIPELWRHIGVESNSDLVPA